MTIPYTCNNKYPHHNYIGNTIHSKNQNLSHI